jgi:hypothetical protein
MNQLSIKQKITNNIRWGKKKKIDTKTWMAITYLTTFMLAGVACATAVIQWSLGTMNNAPVHVFFERIWSTLVLPLFFINTVIWDLAQFMLELMSFI